MQRAILEEVVSLTTVQRATVDVFAPLVREVLTIVKADPERASLTTERDFSRDDKPYTALVSISRDAARNRYDLRVEFKSREGSAVNEFLSSHERGVLNAELDKMVEETAGWRVLYHIDLSIHGGKKSGGFGRFIVQL